MVLDLILAAVVLLLLVYAHYIFYKALLFEEGVSIYELIHPSVQNIFSLR